MASELRLTTLANNAGTESVDTTYVINGSAKAWVNFDADGSGIPVFDSFNISSTSDVDTGIYVVYFSNSFGTVNYTITNGNSGNAGAGCAFTTNYNTWTTGGTGVKNIRCYDDSRVDVGIGHLAIHGDLA